MGESACLMQTFSHVSDTSHEEAKEGNPIPVLGESISFGRFMSESLAWEKWSSFNQNRYLEEVKKSSKPGSVAQKKAYFEAHYKRIAEKKAAALLDQANASANNVTEPETDDVHIGGTPDLKSDESHCHVAIDQQGNMEVPNPEMSFSTDANECNSNAEMMEEVNQAKYHEVLVENSELVKLPNLHEDIEKMTTTKRVEKPPLKESFATNQESSASTTKMKPSISTAKSSVYNRASKLPSTPARPRTPRKENNPTPNSKKTAKDSVDKKKSATKSLHMSINFAASPSRGSETNKTSPSPTQKIGDLRVSASSTKTSKDCSTPARPRTPRKENNLTPNSKQTAKDSMDKKQSAPKSLHMSINFAPSPSRGSETNKKSFSITQKIGNSRVSASSTKTSKDCSTPLRTPSRASVNGVPKLPPVTPQSERRRTGTPLGHTVHGSRKVDLKWQSLSVDRSQSSSTSGNKAWSPSVCSSFVFRSDERAAKRKEYFQKLEEKFNAKDAQKMQFQAKSKDKAETELQKLRQSLGFKAKPMPDFYRQSESPKNRIKKIPLTRPRSPKLGRKPCPSTVQDTSPSPLPPRRPSAKSDGSKHAMEKTTRTLSRSVISLPKKKAHENASSNIQS